jgi:hypothetical protein|tara:strand:- start:9489 stop:9875 length:387 start_codon:yes stop_codon:yes gene_type:complete
MEKSEIKKVLRENTIGLEEKTAPNRHINHAISTKTNDETKSDNEYEKIVKLLDNDMINHAAIGRRMKGDEWGGNSEATNRSKFRKKVKRMQNDEGGTYHFDEDELSQVQKILMNFSSTISNSLGREGK